MRYFIANLIARLSLYVLKFLKYNATSYPGHIARKIYPNVANDYLTQLSSLICITGTNGKSTTTGIYANILNKAQDQYLHNLAGANLLNGIITTCLSKTNLIGKYKYHYTGLLECDEAVLQHITKYRPANIITVNNFFRDQLDRFGELDNIINLVKQGIQLTDSGILILNADDPLTYSLKYKLPDNINILTYGIRPEIFENSQQVFNAGELAYCPICNEALEYTSVQWLGQFGDYHCAHCMNSDHTASRFNRPEPDIEIIALNTTIDHTEFTIQYQGIQSKYTLQQAGLFNLYNALSAISIACTMSIKTEFIQLGIQEYKPLFGRSEIIQYKNIDFQVFLIKNPVGGTEVLRLLAKQNEDSVIIIAINDNYADGCDISWLWDCYFEYLAQNKFRIIITGSRYSDMAVRAKYADLNVIYSTSRQVDAINHSVKYSKEHNIHNQYIIATYTALLSYMNILKRQISES